MRSRHRRRHPHRPARRLRRRQGKRFCSARSFNGITTYRAEATVTDPSLARRRHRRRTTPSPKAPGSAATRASPTTPSTTPASSERKPWLAVATPARSPPCDYTRPVPCNNGPGRIAVDTTKTLREGTQPLRGAGDRRGRQRGRLRAGDGAGGQHRPGGGAVEPSRAGGLAVRELLRRWAGQNPDEGDRAPIAAAHWRICRPDGTACVTGSQPGAGVARLADLRVPEPRASGTLRVVREDAAGNRNDGYASPPVRLRLDSSAPALSFRERGGDRPDPGGGGGRTTGSRRSPAARSRSAARARTCGRRCRPGWRAAGWWPASTTRRCRRAAICCAARPATWPATWVSPRRRADHAAAADPVHDAGRRRSGDRGGAQEGRQGQEAPHRAAQGDRAAPAVPGCATAMRVHDRRAADQPRRPAAAGPAVQVLGRGPSGEQLLATLTTDAQGALQLPGRRVGAAARCGSSSPGRWWCCPPRAQVSLDGAGGGQLQAVAQAAAQRRPAGVPRPRGRACRCPRRASWSSCRSNSRRGSGPPSARCAPTPRDAGRCATASGACAATPATGCGPTSRPRPATRSPPATPARVACWSAAPKDPAHDREPTAVAGDRRRDSSPARGLTR